MFFDPADGMRPPPLKHSPYKSLVVPRPIGWISTISTDGVVNLAPFSYFNAVSDDPPLVMYCPNGGHPEGGKKDSLKNVEETGEFVFNLASWETREQMNASSEHVARGIDEMAHTGLAALPSEKVRPPRVAAAPAHFECVLQQVVTLPKGRGGHGNYMVIGQVVGIHIDDRIIVDGKIDIGRLRPVARLGYFDYAVVDEAFEMRRPD